MYAFLEYTWRKMVSKQADCLRKTNCWEVCGTTEIFFHRGTVSLFDYCKRDTQLTFNHDFLNPWTNVWVSGHLLGCGERADEVHAALVEWLEEGIVLGDLDGEALGVEHFIRARRRRRQRRHLWSFFVGTKEAKANTCVVLKFCANKRNLKDQNFSKTVLVPFSIRVGMGNWCSFNFILQE